LKAEKDAKKNGTTVPAPEGKTETTGKDDSGTESETAKPADDAGRKSADERAKIIEDRKKAADEKRAKIIADRKAAKDARDAEKNKSKDTVPTTPSSEDDK